jgi:hypothetical protein
MHKPLQGTYEALKTAIAVVLIVLSAVYFIDRAGVLQIASADDVSKVTVSLLLAYLWLSWRR